MRCEFLLHEHAWALAATLLGLVERSLTPEARREMFTALYEAAKAELRRYEERAERLRRRVSPG